MERVALTEAEKWKPEQTELERGTVNRNARWACKEGFCSEGLGWHAIKLNVILQATKVHLDCERRVM